MPRLGLLIPEFPTQTHIAMWRLGRAIARTGVEVEMLSTRRPQGEAAVHPALAEAAEQTFYCWPARAGGLLNEAIRAWARVPAALWYAASLREGGLRQRAAVAGMILPALALKRRCRERRLGHVFVHSCASAAHVAAISRILGGPAYSLRLGGDLDVYGVNQADKMRRATVVVGAARVNMEQVLARTRVPGERAIWSWLGVETGKYRPGLHAPDPSRPMRLVTVARLNHAKGHRFVLDAMALALTKGVEMHWTIVGDGPERAAIVQQARSLDLEQRVELTGALDEEGVRAALQMAEVFVLPTSGPGEGSPVAVLEAMSAGLAIVASDVGGLREMVGDEQGVIVPAGDSGALSEALVALARDGQRRAAMGRSSRERALREFDVDAVARRLVGYFFPKHKTAPARIPGEIAGEAVGVVGRMSGPRREPLERAHDAA